MATSKSKASINKSRRSTFLTLFVLIIVAAVLVILVLELTNTTHIFHKTSTKAVVVAGKPVPAPKTVTNSVQQQPTNKNISTNNSSVNGGATDTQGTATPTTNSSQWVTSQSGLITVKSPSANSQLQNGSILAGSSQLSQVNFRLIDNVAGVIAQGTLNVVNGNFSGTLHFKPQGTGGRLDVFSTNAQGIEYNEVQINLSF